MSYNKINPTAKDIIAIPIEIINLMFVYYFEFVWN